MLRFIIRFQRRLDELIARKGVAAILAILLAALITVGLKALMGD